MNFRKLAVMLIMLILLILSLYSVNAISAVTCSHSISVKYYTVPEIVTKSVCVVNRNDVPVTVTFTAPNNEDIINFRENNIVLDVDEKRFVPFDTIIDTPITKTANIISTFSVPPGTDTFPVTSASSSAYIYKVSTSCDENDTLACKTLGCEGIRECVDGSYTACIKDEPSCGAECSEGSECPDVSCDAFDGCIDNRYHDCENIINECREDQTCERNICVNTELCPQVADNDGDGFNSECGDCDDNNPNAFPGALEILDNGVDEDCDGIDNKECSFISPLDGIYNSRKLPLTITCPVPQYQIRYSINRPYLSRLCSSCTIYNRTKYFYEGLNNLTINTTDYKGNSFLYSSQFYIDSTSPRIYKTLPNRGYTDGIFTIEYRELNLVKTTLFYRIVGDTEFLPVEKTECLSGNRVTCELRIENIESLDGNEIEYYVLLQDLTGNEARSRIYDLVVDLSPPVITQLTPFEAIYDTNRVLFDFEFDEDVKFMYIDNLDKTPKNRTVCSRCDDYSRTKSLVDGLHKITVYAIDGNGNTAQESYEFVTDSQKPRISQIKPSSKYANTFFTVKYREPNCEKIIITIFGETGVVPYEFECKPDGSYYAGCSSGTYMIQNFTIDTSQFEGQLINYSVTVRDILNQETSKIVKKLKVDTLPIPINGLTHYVDDRYLVLNMTFPEKVKYLKYIDLENNRERSLCSGCTEYGSTSLRKKYFRTGDYSIILYTEDYAGNKFFSEQIDFTTN